MSMPSLIFPSLPRLYASSTPHPFRLTTIAPYYHRVIPARPETGLHSVNGELRINTSYLTGFPGIALKHNSISLFFG